MLLERQQRPEIAQKEVPIEHFVDAERGAKFLGITRRRLLEMARAGEIPGHPIGRGKRKTWRFRLSELADTVVGKLVAPTSKRDMIEIGSPRQPNRRN
jgi:hypothetical protein